MLAIEKQILFLIAGAEALSVQELCKLYELRGVSQQTIQDSLVSLEQDECVYPVKQACYAVTETGKTLLQTTNRKRELLKQRWDGHWQVVMFESPAALNDKGERLCGDLLRLGFGSLYKNTYITPWDPCDTVISLVNQYELGDMVRIFAGHFLANNVTAAEAQRYWPLAALNQTYAEKRDWFFRQFKPKLERSLVITDNKNLLLFNGFLELGEVMADISLRDPMLPVELLTHDWMGRKCFREFTTYLHMIANAIETDSEYFVFVRQYLGIVEK